MIKDIRLSKYGPLEHAALTNLAKINVISGPNNSGKSTLLQALNSPEHRGRGSLFDIASADAISDVTIKDTGWAGAPDRVRENAAYRSVIRSIFAGSTWYEDDVKELTAELVKQFQANAHLSNWSMGVSSIMRLFRERFGAFPPTALIPPKRVLESSAALISTESVKQSGAGLLNFLFVAKNQSVGDDRRKLYDRISAAFNSISSGYRFDIFVRPENTIALQFSRGNGPWVEAEQRGLGLQDLLVLIYFAFEPKSQILLIEEPESHIHPDMQRRLLVSFKNDTDKQYLFSTHSNIFLNNALVDRVFSTRFAGTITVNDETARASLLDDLGYSVADNLVSDLVVLVEGPSDGAVLEELFVKQGLYRKYEVKIWPLGGDIMDQIDLSVMSERYKVIALIDRDPKSAKVRRRFERRCNDLSIPVHRLMRYSIENYFSVAALRTVFGAQIPALVTAIDLKVKLEDQIQINVKNNNRRLARAMSLSDISGTDLEAFLATVEKLCRDAQTA
jgi:predicted ATPase/5S rRNA maturation endonuclease (ribonuclease M5)